MLVVSHSPEHAPVAGVPALRIGEVTLRLADRMLLDAAGQEVPLRPSEFSLLLAFARNPGRVLSRDQLLDVVSRRRAEPFDRSIDVLVGRLRRKVEVDPKRPRLIQTVSGLGYKLAVKPRPVELPVAAEEGALADDVPKSAPRPPERRQLTVLRCALADAAHIASRLDPEDWRRVIAAVHDGCDRIIARFGGLMVGPRGDNVVAYFGYPEAHENDAERAIRAGLDMIAATAKLAPDLPASVAAKVGIATGIVVVGDLLDPHAQMALGEAPELAARLASQAQARSVVISEATRRLVSGLFAYQALSPSEAFRVLGEGEAASRFEALRGPDLTRFVGREEEIALLRRRWQRAATGAGRVVHISGEPGIGKSRLVREFQNEITAETETAISCFCAPLYQDSTYYPIIREIEHAAGFGRSDAPVQRLGKLEALLQGSGTSPEGIALIADLVSVPTCDRYPPLDLSPRQRRDRTVQTWLARVESMARHRPVLIVFEDVHWIDPSSREVLDALVERIGERPILLILTARPDFSPSWPGAVVVDTLVLNRLEDADVAGMIEAVGGELPDAMRRQIVARADGVPLYVEELTKTAVEVGAVSLPASLSDSLIARLDRAPAAKVVAQIGAVVGRSFSHELLAAMTERPEEVSGLDRLLASGLVSRRGAPPDATYTFKHALVQDAAYESLLKSRRAALHARLVDVLIAREPDIEDTQPDVLAHHCEQAALTERAIEYYLRAGWRTFRPRGA